MNKDLTIKGTVEKVVRANGQPDAQVTITIPISSANIVPLGAVNILIESLQASIWNKPVKKGGKIKGIAAPED